MEKKQKIRQNETIEEHIPNKKLDKSREELVEIEIKILLDKELKLLIINMLNENNE